MRERLEAARAQLVACEDEEADLVEELQSVVNDIADLAATGDNGSTSRVSSYFVP